MMHRSTTKTSSLEKERREWRLLPAFLLDENAVAREEDDDDVDVDTSRRGAPIAKAFSPQKRLLQSRQERRRERGTFMRQQEQSETVRV